MQSAAACERQGVHRSLCSHLSSSSGYTLPLSYTLPLRGAELNMYAVNLRLFTVDLQHCTVDNLQLAL